MMSDKIFFIDIDGVLCDIVSPVLDYHGLCIGDIPKGEYDLCKVFGMDVWDVPEDVYIEAPLTAECYQLLATHPNAILLSATPSHFIPVRLEWLTLRNITNQVIFCTTKHLLAAPGRTLIDDCDDEVTNWRNHGGDAILMSRQWNKGE